MTEIKTSEGKEVKRKRSVEKYRLYKNNFIQSHYVSYSICDAANCRRQFRRFNFA